MNGHRYVRGVTIVELLVSLAIIAILAVMAAPSFQEMQHNNRRNVQLDAFWHAIFLARSEAIKRNSVVVLCKVSTSGDCNNAAGNWVEGWMVFDNLDHDEPAQRDADEPILRSYLPSGDINNLSRVTSNRQTFSFRPSTQGAVNGTLVFCDSRGSGAARAIIISHTGRPRQSNRDASNRPLNCAAS